MLIVDQSRYNLVNLDRTINIGIEEKSTLTDTREITAQTDGYTVILGKYETEERAKQVLEEVANKYRQYNLDNNQAVTIIPKVYYMPEK